MKKKSLISRIREETKLRELKRPELALAVGGRQTLTNCGGQCTPHWEEDAPPPP
jgi:hypothetical protein